MYTIKIAKYLKLPIHLRWELYPVMHEEAYHYGGSCFEKKDWWTYPRTKFLYRTFGYLLKDYLYFESYLKKGITYWLFLYISHIGFILLMFLQVIVILGAVLNLNGISVIKTSTYTLGYLLYFLTEFIGPLSFIAGIIGNLGLLIMRAIKSDLKLYTSPFMYYGYLFHILLYVSGFITWHKGNYSLIQYREFWEGLLQLQPIDVTPDLAFFIILMGLHLLYLPFTRAIHYITRLFAFYLIRWDDKPNIRGGELEKKIIEQLNKNVSWSGPHIESGKRWSDQFTNSG